MAPLNGKSISYTGVVADRIDLIETAIKGLGAEVSRDIGLRSVDYLVAARRFSPKYNFCASSNVPILSLERFFDIYKRFAMGENFDVLEATEKARLLAFEGLRVTMSRMDPKTEEEVSKLIEANGGEFKRALTRDCDIVLSSSLNGKKIKFAQQWQIPIVQPSWVFKSVEQKNALDPIKYATDGLQQEEEVNSPPPAESLVVDFKAGPKRRGPDEWDDLFVSSVKKPAKSVPTPSNTIESQEKGMFWGMAFALRGFNDREEKILRKTISSHDGSFLPPFDYMIVSSKQPTAASSSASTGSVPEVTEWAIERSLDRKRALFDLWGQPVLSRSLPQFKRIKICLSGFKGIELVHLERLVEMLGAELTPTLTIDRDVLIAASTDCSKFAYANKWNIPIVNEKWLWDCARDGRVCDITNEYALDGKGYRQRPVREPLTVEAQEYEPEKNSLEGQYVEYGSDGEQTPVGRDYVQKSVPLRRSRRKA